MRRVPLLVIGASFVLMGGVFAFTGYADAAGSALWIMAGAVCALLSNGRPS
jgi:hypothetical protein